MLRSEYSASIKLPDSPGPERIFSVAAQDAETVADIIGIHVETCDLICKIYYKMRRFNSKKFLTFFISL